MELAEAGRTRASVVVRFSLSEFALLGYSVIPVMVASPSGAWSSE